MRRLAFEDAAHHFRTALDALERLPADAARRFRVLASLADALDSLAMPDVAQPLWLEAADLARQRGDSDGLFRTLAGYTYVMRLSSDPNVDRLLDDLLELLPAGDSPTPRPCDGLESEPGETPRQRDAGAKAVAMAQRTGDADGDHGHPALHGVVRVSEPRRERHARRRRGPLPDDQSAEPLPSSTPAIPGRLRGASCGRGCVWAVEPTRSGSLAECGEQAAESRQGIAMNNSLLWHAAIATAEGRFNDGKRIAAEAQDTRRPAQRHRRPRIRRSNPGRPHGARRGGQGDQTVFANWICSSTCFRPGGRCSSESSSTPANTPQPPPNSSECWPSDDSPLPRRPPHATSRAIPSRGLPTAQR